ncbi:MAG: hypothetical protein QM704_08600 [Anaeromyxobacteraceae bacterium]
MLPALLLAAALAADPVPPAACGAPQHRAFDFWLGTWDVTAGAKTAGQNHIERILSGCGLQEHWTGAKGNRGTSLNWFDPADGKWHQLWLDDQGTVLKLEGGPRDGGMVLEGEAPGPGGKLERQRITWSRLDGGKVRQRWEASADGKAWRVVFDGLYAPRG